MCGLTSCSCCIAITVLLLGVLIVFIDPPNKDSRTSPMGETDPLPERRMVLVGITGSGKSASGNTILGKKTFLAGALGSSVTGKIQADTAERFQRKLVVVDTPGLFDTDGKKTNRDILKEISKCYAVTSPGVHAIILVIPIGRITDRIDETVNIFLKHFGDDASSVMIVLFTFKLLLELQQISLDTYIKSIPTESPLNKILEQVNGRYLAIGYTGEKEERSENLKRDEEVKQLLDMIDKNVENLPYGFYSNEVFRKMEQYLLKEEENIKSKYWKINDKQTIRDKLRKLVVGDINDVFDPYFQYFLMLYNSFIY